MQQYTNPKQEIAKTPTAEICYETFGKKSDPCVMLIMGMGMQMINWPEALCEKVASAGFFVVRFDNRDTGFSQKFEGLEEPSLLKASIFSSLGLKLKIPYTLDDMAGDVIGLMDVLKVQKAHFVGASMGGMIAQILASEYSDRTLSLTSIMSTSGARWTRGWNPTLTSHLINRPLTGKKEIINHTIRTYELVGPSKYPQSEEVMRAKAERSYDRSFYPQATMRHALAITLNGDRSRRLRKIQCPATVIHDREDQLVPFRGGWDTARKIPNASFHPISGLAHSFVPEIVGELSSLIIDHISSTNE